MRIQGRQCSTKDRFGIIRSLRWALTIEDLYLLNLTSSTWTTWTPSGLASWAAVEYINAVHSPQSNGIYVWGGSDGKGQKSQFLSLDLIAGNASVYDTGVKIDSCTGVNVFGSILWYGGHGYGSGLWSAEVYAWDVGFSLA